MQKGPKVHNASPPKVHAENASASASDDSFGYGCRGGCRRACCFGS